MHLKLPIPDASRLKRAVASDLVGARVEAEYASTLTRYRTIARYRQSLARFAAEYDRAERNWSYLTAQLNLNGCV